MERGRRARGAGRGGCGPRATLLVAAAAVGLLVLAQAALSPQLWSRRRGLVRASGAASGAGAGAALAAGEQGDGAFSGGGGRAARRRTSGRLGRVRARRTCQGRAPGRLLMWERLLERGRLLAWGGLLTR